ncbi:VOC family protein [Psychroserpens sp. SPM9]|uniref:bleomycin resistance protein n=1 Tax=Psychroserpens sp. SPM9 TaxID=2975598 RepID=UPI0021A2D55B|nr:VOC family protein [Psychroserpens sp. SPM9]MDG5492966.1 VOC family protein [Psychroserpens sp. SPM9]
MLTHIHPKLPMRQKSATKAFYKSLGFKTLGDVDYEGYLMLKMDAIELHFFEFKTLNPLENYGQVYIRLDDIETFYQTLIAKHIAIHPNGSLKQQPWGQLEFSVLDPDSNLLTFGQAV